MSLFFLWASGILGGLSLLLAGVAALSKMHEAACCLLIIFVVNLAVFYKCATLLHGPLL